MVLVLQCCSKVKGKSATSPSHASTSGTIVSLNSVEDVPQLVSSQDEQFQPTPPVAPSITLSHSKDVTLPTTAFGKKLKVHIDLDKGRQLHMEIEDIGDEAIQEKIEQLLKNRSRDAWYKLQNHFKKFTTLEESQRNKPKENSLTQDNWNLLCKYWFDLNVKV
ncbi:hypothetical protein Patl1_05607 [Pistacia atlantica]|uniref:Uncharacterized protein n=1 Tax=Pistacia atlantica TaxID=434234 RepID=A0ACC1BVS9_9ROSI|nr:hypothetical protein Patl1_05607 [Pistacia atlantica]